MFKGEKIGLISVGMNHEPGPVVSAIVCDNKNKIITCEVESFNNTATAMFILEDYFESMSIQNYFGGNPAIIQLKNDATMDYLFAEENLTPKFNRKTLRYEYKLNQKFLDDWTKVGVLIKQRIDWHYACSDCDTMITIREGCCNCYATVDKKNKLIRHNKCGYVGFGKQFDDWKCPQCKINISDQFNIIFGPNKCESCGFTENPIQIAGCLGCGNFFPLSQAKEMSVFKYFKSKPILKKTFDMIAP